MGNLQNNIRGQITRAWSNESNQATDNVSSRQTAPAEQSQQSFFTRHTLSGVRLRISGHDPRMDQTAFEVYQSLWSETDEQFTRLTRTIWSRWTPGSAS